VVLALFEKEVEVEGYRGVGFLSPSRRVCEAGFNAFEKVKCLVYIAPVGSLEKSRECFSLRDTHWTLAQRHQTLCLCIRCAVSACLSKG